MTAGAQREPGAPADLPGIDRDGVTAWMLDRADGVVPPLRFDLVGAGGSNLTFDVGDGAGNRWALRRPPVRNVLPTAHDMAREHRIVAALAEHTDVPVPAPVGFCRDPAVTGAPFWVSEFVDGLILRDEKTARTLGEARAQRATESLVDVQVAFHGVDLDAVGLADLGKHDGYVERQLRRWHRQYESSKSRDLPLVDALHARLASTVPVEESEPGLAHGDYRFDNTVLGPDGRIVAVLDWELCTVGDPVADFCWSLMYWADPGDPYSFLQSPPTLVPELPTRGEVAELYARRSGRDLAALDWFLAFGWWKMACIVEGVHARQRAGARGGKVDDTALAAIAERVETMLDLSDEAAGRAGI
ncbi:MAG TPA: phosphotransferase family protein [Acidimicrobiia bacterium]